MIAPMRIAAPVIVSPFRLARYFAWAWLWLLKHALFLVEASPDARRRLDAMARFIAQIIFLKAASILRLEAPPRRHRPRTAPSGFRARTQPRAVLRAIIGSALRKRLSARTPGRRLAALFCALADAHALAARLARRLRGRLTRRFPIIPARPPSDAQAANAPAHAPCITDTS
jgi:hypothetical protein